MQTIICDACEAVTESPLVVEWDRPDPDDDELVWGEEAHLCSWQCLASWAMTQHLETQ